VEDENEVCKETDYLAFACWENIRPSLGKIPCTA